MMKVKIKKMNKCLYQRNLKLINKLNLNKEIKMKDIFSKIKEN